MNHRLLKRIIYLSRKKRFFGPYRVKTVRRFVENGIYGLDEFGWVKGMHSWDKLGVVFETLEKKRRETEVATPEVSPRKQAEKIWNLLQKNQLNLAMDLNMALDSIEVSTAIIEEIGFQGESFQCSSNLKMPDGVDTADGLTLFLSCLSLLARTNQIPDKFLRMKEFHLSFYVPLAMLQPLELLPCLERISLDFSEASDVQDLSFFEKFPNLCELGISDFEGNDFGFLTKLNALEKLTIENCPNLLAPPSIACEKTLRTLSFSNCQNLKSLEGLGQATALEKLSLFGCESLTDLDALENFPELCSLDLRCCSSLQEEGPIAQMQFEDIFLGGCPLTFIRLGRTLRESSLGSLKMIWNGSGDDGWYEGSASDREGREVDNEESNELLATLEGFVCMKVPGGAGNDAGSYGVLEVDALRGQATWRFHWRDGLQFFRDRTEEWSQFEILKFKIGFMVDQDHPAVDDLKDTSSHWQWAFDEYDGPMGLTLIHAFARKNDSWIELPIENFLAIEDMLKQWNSETYYGEVDQVLAKLCNGCTGDLPDYLLDRELSLELDCVANEAVLRIDGNSEKLEFELEQEIEIFSLREKSSQN